MLKLIDIEKSYRISGKKKIILHKLNLEINAGEIIAITGKSGCGKTTLLNIIAGLTSPSKGRVIFEGKRMFYPFDIMPAFIRNRRVGFIFQTFRLLYNETVASNVLLPARIKGIVNRATVLRMEELLARLEIPEYRKSIAGVLSGGQKQRVAIARALINDPSLILADEPTANLDMQTSVEIFKVLEQFARDENKAVLIVTHKDYMLKHADRVYSMKDGVLEDLR
jgi:putative ABC transport system ATP-binding protein